MSDGKLSGMKVANGVLTDRSEFVEVSTEEISAYNWTLPRWSRRGMV